MSNQDVRPGVRVTFMVKGVKYAGVVASTDGQGHAVIEQISPPLAGNSTVSKSAGELTAA
jgi:hypothetical protein